MCGGVHRGLGLWVVVKRDSSLICNVWFLYQECIDVLSVIKNKNFLKDRKVKSKTIQCTFLPKGRVRVIGFAEAM